MSMTWGEAVPRTLVRRVVEARRLLRYAGVDGRLPGLAGSMVLLRLTKAVLIERPIIRRMSTMP